MKYTDAAPDLIITITEPALDFVLRHRRELFPDAALLFGAVDERAMRSRNLGPNATGVFTRIDARATLEAALALHPHTRRVVVVGGRSDKGYMDAVREELRPLASRTDIAYVTDKALRDVVAGSGRAQRRRTRAASEHADRRRGRGENRSRDTGRAAARRDRPDLQHVQSVPGPRHCRRRPGRHGAPRAGSSPLAPAAKY